MEVGKGVVKPKIRPTDRAQHLWDKLGSYPGIVRGKEPVPEVLMGACSEVYLTTISPFSPEQ